MTAENNKCICKIATAFKCKVINQVYIAIVQYSVSFSLFLLLCIAFTLHYKVKCKETFKHFLKMYFKFKHSIIVGSEFESDS